MILEGKKHKYQLVVGIEVHAQVNIKKKLFSNAINKWDDTPNTNVGSFDIAIPGILPIFNTEVLEPVIMTGLAINANINKVSFFDRKHYFYPDLPNGYQITQFYNPIITDGFLMIENEDKSKKKIRINRIHIEQDAGKLIHDIMPGKSCIDFNRAGCALMEIVSEPDMRTVHETLKYLEKLQQTLRCINSCVADLEKGTFRADVNLSLMNLSTNQFGTRCEIKNLNSFTNIKKAIEFEANRQFDILESGQLVNQETRLFNVEKNQTETLRNKENAIDYRYLQDPDLQPIILHDEFINNIKNKLPELPDIKHERYKNIGLSEKEITFLCSSPVYYNYFEKLIQFHEPKLSTTWMLTELIGKLNKLSIKFENCPVSSADIINLLNLIKNNTINGKIAKDILDEMIQSGKSAEIIIEEKGLSQITDEAEIKNIVIKILDRLKSQVEEYKNGNPKLFPFFVGSVMKETKGKANPDVINKILKNILD